jgi:hypothetical protein
MESNLVPIGVAFWKMKTTGMAARYDLKISSAKRPADGFYPEQKVGLNSRRQRLLWCLSTVDVDDDLRMRMRI